MNLGDRLDADVFLAQHWHGLVCVLGPPFEHGNAIELQVASQVVGQIEIELLVEAQREALLLFVEPHFEVDLAGLAEVCQGEKSWIRHCFPKSLKNGHVRLALLEAMRLLTVQWRPRQNSQPSAWSHN